MMSLYCPKCKNEYQEGYTHCADCDCDLVAFEELYPKKPIYFGKEEEIDVLISYLEANRMKTVEKREAEEEDVFEIYVEEKEEKTANSLLKIYLLDKSKSEALALSKEEESSEDKEEEMYIDPDDLIDDSIEDQVKQELKDMHDMAQMYEPVKIHENSKAKGQEYKSTGVMLIIVGLIGIVIDILMLTGHFVITFTGSGKYMSAGVMGALFLAFMIFGVSSLKSADRLLTKGDEEESLEIKIDSWVKENLTKDSIDEEEDLSDVDESVAYFKRTEIMKNKILENFKIEEGLLEELIEKYYDEIFGE